QRSPLPGQVAVSRLGQVFLHDQQPVTHLVRLTAAIVVQLLQPLRPLPLRPRVRQVPTPLLREAARYVQLLPLGPPCGSPLPLSSALHERPAGRPAEL
ncbi:MAG: hypothetical protein ACO2YV_12940, partial [Pseudomonadales bacterium]